jgi:hypothetical protein
MVTSTMIIYYLVGMMCFLLLLAVEIMYQKHLSKQKIKPINDNLKVDKLTNDEIDFIETARKDYLEQFELILCSIHHMILKSNPSYYRENNRDLVLVLDMKLYDLNPPDLRIICHGSGQLEVVYDQHTDTYDSIQQINMSKSLMLNEQKSYV